MNRPGIKGNSASLVTTELKHTADGSHTLYVPALDEHYHSLFGALTESRHIFISAGLATVGRQNIEVLEVGFGTGLNALLTALYAAEHQLHVTYTSLEKYPLEQPVIDTLNYGSITGERGQKTFEAIHEALWGIEVNINEWFTLKKIESDLTRYDPEGIFDLIYFDAFGPDKQPEMWSEEVMQRITAVTQPGTVLVTYSAKGSLKRMLKALGFDITLLPGPPGKRVMTRAVKK
jgi:tRNA U34 5-methylaminomethyl-2-thiouridine-forming methyltransferase MnmC